MEKTARLMALIAVMLCLPVASKAQNFQVLYDANRDCVTTAFEMFRADDFSKTWSFSAMYKVIPGVIGLNGKEQPHNFQLTGVWGVNFADGWCSFSGFADFWRQAFIWQGAEYIFMAVPQLWVNLNKVSGWEKINLSIGGEVEFSNNFMGKGLYVIINMACGNFKKITPTMYILATLFILKYIYL